MQTAQRATGVRRPVVPLSCLGIAAATLTACSSIPFLGDGQQDATISGIRNTGSQLSEAERPDDPAPDSAQESPRGDQLSMKELRSQNRAFADRYRAVLGSACDEIMRKRRDPVLRKKAHQLKLDGATSVYDIVLAESPQEAQLNLLVQVTLQKKLADASAQADFPDDHPLVESSIEQLYNEAWSLGALVMDEGERVELLVIIDRWWESNSTQQDIWYVRLNDLAGYDAGTSLEGALDSARGLPSQILNSFVPLESASDSLDEISVIAESASWFASRLVILTQWRLEAIVFESLASTQITTAIDTFERIADTADTLPGELQTMVEATLDRVAEQEESLSPLLDRAESVLAEATRTTNEATELTKAIGETSKSLESLGTTVDPIIARFTEKDDAEEDDSAEDEGRPFNITEYTEAVRALEEALEQTEDTIGRIESATDEQSLESRLGAVSGTVGTMVLYITLGVAASALALVAAIVGGVLAVRWWSPGRHTDRERPRDRRLAQT